MENCSKCDGSGLIGNGPNPHLREGAVSTCDVCGGTGKVAVATEASAPAPVEPVTPPAEESPKVEAEAGSAESSAGSEPEAVVTTEAAAAPVDNETVTESSEGATV